MMMNIRPTWENYLMGLAFFVAARSHDSETQHGCVICDEKHRPLGMGYNGFPASIYEKGLPTTRPDKYPWMIHSEANAVNNMRVKIDDTIAFVTGQCCNPCIMNLYNNGIRTVYMADCHGSHILNEEDQKIFNDFVKRTVEGKEPLTVHKIKPDLNWVVPVISKLINMGFINKNKLLEELDQDINIKLSASMINYYNPIYMKKDAESRMILIELENKSIKEGYSHISFDKIKIGEEFRFLDDSSRYVKTGVETCTSILGGLTLTIPQNTIVKVETKNLKNR